MRLTIPYHPYIPINQPTTTELRQHFEDLKQTYLLMQSVTRTMRGQQNAVNPPPGGNNTSANPSRGPSPAPSTNPAEQPQQQDGGPVSLSAVFPEMWRPFDSSKTWPMCIFYRNPGACVYMHIYKYTRGGG